MKVSKIICDGCGKEISGDPIQFFGETVDAHTCESKIDDYYINEDRHYCNCCGAAIADKIEHFINKHDKVAYPNPVFEKSVKSMIPDNLPKPGVPVPANPPVPEEKKPVHIPLPEEKSVKLTMKEKQQKVVELTNQGLSTAQISEKIGISRNSVQQYRYLAKKNTELPDKPLSVDPEVKPIDCNGPIGKKCKYRGSHGTCDYIEKCGHSRGCPPDECTRYKLK